MGGYRSLRRAVAQVRFGNLGRIDPVSDWGTPRGLPIDRWYIERFLAEHAGVIRGRALEVKDDQYATRFGASSVDVVDIDAHNARATIVADLCSSGALPRAAFDVAIITQTLQLVADPMAAVRHVLQSLRAGSSLLLTVPSLSRLAGETDRWRWTPAGMRTLATIAAPPGAEIESVGLGNGLSARAFLFGLAADDLDEEVLARTDPNYPLLVGCRVRLAA